HWQRTGSRVPRRHDGATPTRAWSVRAGYTACAMRLRKVLLRFAALLLLSATVAAGQIPSFRTETRLVVLHATVLNSKGTRVNDLSQQAFTVYENGKPQPITLFRHDDVPISVGLLIDNSGSMRPLRSRIEHAALAFARASNPEDELFVLNFADRVRVD